MHCLSTIRSRGDDENCDLTRLHIPKRIAMIRPSERHELHALKAAGFTGYLVKPVRAASLAARLAVSDTFEHSASEVATKQPTPRLTQSKVCRSWLPKTTKSMRCWRARSSARLGHRPTIAVNGEAAVESWLAARASGCRVRSCADGPADAGDRRLGSRPPHPCS